MTNIERVAIYRVLYGEDFIQESIKSILPFVDKVFVIKSEKPWGNTKGVNYKGKYIEWPTKFDNTREKLKELNLPISKLEVIDDYFPTPAGQLTYIVNNLILNRCRPREIVFIEPDHVFSYIEATNAFDCWDIYSGNVASTKQIELWKYPTFRIPERPNRTSILFYRIFGQPLPPTGFNGAIGEDLHRLNATVHNLGFCLSDEIMYWKHLTALAFSRIVGDSEPNEAWYEEKWLNWDLEKNNKDLEISKGYEWVIPCAVPYDVNNLPELIKNKYNY